MEILRTVRLTDIDPVYFETSYYVVPEAVGERAYALLYAALKEAMLVAIAQIAMHGREHVVVVRPGAKGLLVHTLYYNDEVRAETEFATITTAVVPKELALAKTFVEAIAGTFALEEFTDGYRQHLQKLISQKVAREEVVPAPSATRTVPLSVDIMDALTKSLERARKPPKVETKGSGRGVGKVTSEKPRRKKA